MWRDLSLVEEGEGEGGGGGGGGEEEESSPFWFGVVSFGLVGNYGVCTALEDGVL
jgi:hypothetical protein